tara:strand:- start:6063 stop:7166 length:1104 start_codon:yes stop_codon:yes gene_type:complete
MICRVCDSNSLELFLTLKNMPCSAQGFSTKLNTPKRYKMSIFECKSCGVFQHLDKPVPYFKSVIRANSYSKEMYKYRFKQLKEWIQRNNLENKKIIEIGSGSGDFLEILKNINLSEFYGMEFSKKNHELIVNKGFKAFKHFLDKPLISKKKFDGFLIFSFLEHWPKPRILIENLHHLLKENAVGIIEVPNFDLIKKNGMYTEFINDHITYFTKRSFNNFLTNNGFEVKKIKSIRHDYILSAEVKKIVKTDNTLFIDNQNFIRNQIVKFTRNSPFVVWGAGHQSLSVLSVANLKNLKFIVDSAKFKQEKYVPSLAVKIKDPEYLNSFNIDFLIIIGGSYSNEIFKITKKNYPFIKNVAILKNNFLEIK